MCSTLIITNRTGWRYTFHNGGGRGGGGAYFVFGLSSRAGFRPKGSWVEIMDSRVCFCRPTRVTTTNIWAAFTMCLCWGGGQTEGARALCAHPPGLHNFCVNSRRDVWNNTTFKCEIRALRWRRRRHCRTGSHYPIRTGACRNAYVNRACVTV